MPRTIDDITREFISITNEETGPDGATPKFEEIRKFIGDYLKSYGAALDAKGLNLKDAFETELTHFNRSGITNIDPPYAGKSYVFVTRPNLNFKSDQNIAVVPFFNNRIQTELGQWSMTQLQRPGYEFLGRKNNVRTMQNSKILDSCFIPLLTNRCTSSSGGKDLILDTMQNETDFFGSHQVYAKGMEESLTAGELTLNFDEIYNYPIMDLMLHWLFYIRFITLGRIYPSRYHRTFKEIDYSCSIYVFVLGEDHETITLYAKYTGCFPRSFPLGAIEHNSKSPQPLKELSIPFVYNRYEAMDPTILLEFNIISREFVYEGVKNYCRPTKDNMRVPKGSIIDKFNRAISQLFNVKNENQDISEDNDFNNEIEENRYDPTAPYDTFPHIEMDDGDVILYDETTATRLPPNPPKRKISLESLFPNGKDPDTQANWSSRHPVIEEGNKLRFRSVGDGPAAPNNET